MNRSGAMHSFPLIEGDMKICSPSKIQMSLGQCTRETVNKSLESSNSSCSHSNAREIADILYCISHGAFFQYIIPIDFLCI